MAVATVPRRKGWASRIKDQIRQSPCPEPRCGAGSGTACDHSHDPYHRAKRLQLQRDGTSHYARMVVSYGRPPELALELAAGAASGKPSTAPATRREGAERLSVMLAGCPRHQVAEGEPCPRGGGCEARIRVAAGSSARRAALTDSAPSPAEHAPELPALALGLPWQPPPPCDCGLAAEQPEARLWRAEGGCLCAGCGGLAALPRVLRCLRCEQAWMSDRRAPDCWRPGRMRRRWLSRCIPAVPPGTLAV